MGPSAGYQRLATVIRPTENVFYEQLRYLEEHADLRAERAAEILAQLGVPTPFFASIVSLHQERTRWTLELLFAALRFANFTVLRVKHALACRRPHEYSPRVQPIIQVPLHGTFPSGHATEAFVFALVFSELLRAGGRRPYQDVSIHKQMMAQAARIAINRTIAGVHFPVDSAAGAVLGLTLGNYFIARCGGAGKYEPWTFDGRSLSGRSGLLLAGLLRCRRQTSGGRRVRRGGGQVALAPGCRCLGHAELVVGQSGS